MVVAVAAAVVARFPEGRSMHQHSSRVADAAAATSAFGWLASWATHALPIIQAISGIVAICAGLFEIAYHWKRLAR